MRRIHRRSLWAVMTLLLLGVGLLAWMTAARSRSMELDHALVDAVQVNDLASIKRLLDRGADPDACDYKRTGRASLRHTIALMLRLRREPGQPTALMLTTLYDDAAATRLLLDRGARIDEKDPAGRTALTYAVQAGRTEVVRLLLDRGANINARDHDGLTALMIAADYGRGEVDLLLQRGPDLTARDNEGKTALDHAHESHWMQAENLLRRAAKRTGPSGGSR